MRTAVLLALLTVTMGISASEAWAQTANVAPAVQTAQTAAAQPTAGQAAAEIAGRPDAWRYYWHNGHWWYFTSQNTWIRWNGSAWVKHHSINDSGAFSQGNIPQANMAQPSMPLPSTSQPNGANIGPAPGYDNGGTAAPSYRYDINRRKGGL